MEEYNKQTCFLKWLVKSTIYMLWPFETRKCPLEGKYGRHQDKIFME